MKLYPQLDRILAEPVSQKEQMTESGLFLPQSTREKPQEAVIISVGPGYQDSFGNFINMPYKPGDRIIYQRFAGTELQYGGRTFICLGQKDVMIIVDLEGIHDEQSAPELLED